MRSVPGVGRGVGRREWAHSIALVGCPNLACSCLERAFEEQIVWIDGDLTQLAMMQSVKHQGGGTRRTGLKVQGGTRRTGLTVQNGRVFRGGAVCLCARVQIRRGALLIERGMASPIVAECVEERVPCFGYHRNRHARQPFGTRSRFGGTGMPGGQSNAERRE